MRKILLLLCAIVGALTFTSEAAKKIKINVIPETAKIYIDGQLVGEGTYQREFGITQDPTAGLQMDIDYRAIRRVA